MENVGLLTEQQSKIDGQFDGNNVWTRTVVAYRILSNRW